MGEFFVSRRVAAAALAMGLGATAGCSVFENTDGGVDHYIQGTPSPHSRNSSIPEGRVLPPGVEMQFNDGAVEYDASAEVAASTGLSRVVAFCGNPVDHRDPSNLYASLTVIKEGKEVLGLMTGIAGAESCADGTITEADRPLL